MRKSLGGLIILLAIIFAMVLQAEAVASEAILIESAKTSTLIEGARKLIGDALDKAQNTGDYLLFKNATELKGVVDTWERANANLLGKAFRELNDSQRKFFSDINASADKLVLGVELQAEAATKIAELINQTLADARIFDGSLGFFRYAPRIVYPGAKEDITFTVRGINFDKADPQLILHDNTTARRISLARQEAVFVIPRDVFTFSPDVPNYANFKLSYLNPTGGLFGGLVDLIRGRKNRTSTDVAILQLPQQLATYKLHYKIRNIIRDEWNGQREFHWSGRDESRTITQGPHENGWRMVIASVRQGSTWGEAGKGCHLTSNNEHGFAVEIRVGRISTLTNPNGPGYQHCIWHWQEYIERQLVVDQPAVSGSIGWLNDIPLQLPANRESFLLYVKTWGGFERVTAGALTDRFYRVTEAGQTVVIHPQIPSDLNSL